MSGDTYCTASSVKTGKRLSGCSKGGRLRASNKASKVYCERVTMVRSREGKSRALWAKGTRNAPLDKSQ
ncbi:hypothetical protein DEO72_LG2g3854 [Vigna unguiculata]|uniref:Uncharacterized protein n=1 Tax=Vigna unguiculata TaxID=3917 RepID=A0A4D6L4U9_VIGUN|nr:hypothetical protein DEO72_LG2g3854 [Vigna unguiculata]